MRAIKIEQSITRREDDSIKRYLDDIATYPLLSVNEEVVLSRKILKGDEAALRRLVNANLRFVVSVAKKYEGQGLSLADLISEGNSGLIKAARRYDESRGFKFISYAVWWIRQAIMLAIGEHKRLVRLPMNQVNGILQLRKAETELEQRLERKPIAEELAEFAGLDCDRVKDYQQNAVHTLSLDLPKEEQEDSWLMGIIPDSMFPGPDSCLGEAELKTMVQRLFRFLSKRQQSIISMAFGLDGYVEMQNEDIGSRLGLSSETVRKDRSLALRILRDIKLSRILNEYI